METSAVGARRAARNTSAVGVVGLLIQISAATALLAGCVTGAGPVPSTTVVEHELPTIHADVTAVRGAVARLPSDRERDAGEARRATERQAKHRAAQMDAVVVELDRLSTLLADVTARLETLGIRLVKTQPSSVRSNTGWAAASAA